MIKYLAHDVINDITLLQTNHKLGIPNYHVRYGLQTTSFVDLKGAVDNFKSTQLHALACEGYFETDE